MRICRIAFAVAVTLAIFVVPVRAALVTYDLTYSGAPFNNTAVGTGTITIDTSVLNNPGTTSHALTPYVTAFSITISGATTGNGTFGLADYSDFFLDTGGSTLDLTRQLIGQATAGDPFGTPSGNGGDFNIFLNGVDVNAPGAVGFFTIETSGGGGDPLQLTRFVPTSVPEPSSLVLAGIAALAGLGALARKRRERQEGVSRDRKAD